jgi:hypothetical protein
MNLPSELVVQYRSDFAGSHDGNIEALLVGGVDPLDTSAQPSCTAALDKSICGFT